MKSEEIDLTPVGMQTPEGIERVRVTMQKFENATADVANAATEFFSRWVTKDGDRIALVYLDEGDEAARHDDLKDVQRAIERRARAQDNFLRAVAGR